MSANVSTDLEDWPLAVGGDATAFGRVFDRHGDLVYRFVRRRVGSDVVAEDITSQVFLEAWRRRSEITLLDGSLRAWLIGVARNLERRHWRSSERGTRATRRLSMHRDSADPIEQAIERLDHKAELAQIQDRLDRLSAAHREVILLWAWEELSYDEIAQVLDVAVGTVKSRLGRARQKLAADHGTASPQRASTVSASDRSHTDPVEHPDERNTR